MGALMGDVIALPVDPVRALSQPGALESVTDAIDRLEKEHGDFVALCWIELHASRLRMKRMREGR